MKITGAETLPQPVEQVWDALLDPRVLVATIPGCERLVAAGEHAYEMTVTVGVAAIKGTYSGGCELFDLEPHRSLTMRLSGSGAPGTIDAEVGVRFEDLGAEGTRIHYDADATVGGMLGGVGQRMLTSVSKRMAGEFFGNVGGALTAPQPAAGQPAAGQPAADQPAAGAVFTAPPRPAVSSETDFFKGVVLGAGLVLLGVLAGSRLGRRR
ncbi:SRPBCC family protein [Nocardioides ferulae]|uniref:SRPBCC family protein n=1 Tax=Nocardioides ferulae TaxID=2340821 RepID=UPI000EAB795C|nr:carbon monoxide dehydrogenase subunit G [Nocardioides ferulae]